MKNPFTPRTSMFPETNPVTVSDEEWFAEQAKIRASMFAANGPMVDHENKNQNRDVCSENEHMFRTEHRKRCIPVRSTKYWQERTKRAYPALREGVSRAETE